jgi:hypothetical protein
VVKRISVDAWWIELAMLEIKAMPDDALEQAKVIPSVLVAHGE